MITLGSLFRCWTDMFLVPNRIAAGGVSGLATVIFHIMGFPVGLTMLAINIPLFLASLRILGTPVWHENPHGFFSLSVFVDIMEPFIASPTQDPLLASVYGGVLTGIGLGIVFRSGGTTGGTDLAAQLLLRYVSTSSGRHC